ncbi:tyrosine-type recombinase/integrase [Brucella anthropi]|uniref:tyrosine-type recombinase/integrase n=1 Tax=Brucella anthropi TaxID=529 RepID=UPI00235E7019|nr:site-specific integrase [Brucella anthropi]
MPRLTKTAVDSLPPKDRQYTVWCTDLKGFGVSINPAGTKAYIVDYRTADGARRRMTIGRHGPLTAEEARKLAIKTMGSILQGDDPQLERRTRRKSLTLSGLCDQYTEAAGRGLIIGRAGKPKKKSSIETDKGMIESHIRPLIGNKLVADIKRADIVKFVRDVQSGKTAKQRAASGKLRGTRRISGGNGAATRATATLGALLTYAVSEDIIEANPAFGVKKPAVGRRERRLLPHEYAILGRGLLEASDSPRKAWQGAAVVRLVALTGCRTGEIENLRWTEVNLDDRLLVLDDTKSGKSIRPLGKPALLLLKEIDRTVGSPFVFPAPLASDKGFTGAKKLCYAIFKSAGINDVSPHVLRHSFASVGADLGFSDSTIGAIIGHTGTSMTSRYTHRLDSVLVAAADRIAIEIEKQMAGKSPAK